MNAQIEKARKAGVAALESEPRARAARYSSARRQVVVDLTNGCSFTFPVDKAQGLAGASDKDLSDVKVLGNGFGLHWEKLDADLSIPALVAGIFGSKAWMRELARREGSTKQLLTPATKKSYSLNELVARCDAKAPAPKDMAAWNEITPVGKELD